MWLNFYSLQSPPPQQVLAVDMKQAGFNRDAFIRADRGVMAVQWPMIGMMKLGCALARWLNRRRSKLGRGYAIVCAGTV